MNEPGRATQIEHAKVSDPGSGPEPEGELEGLKMSLRAIFRASKVRLGVRLGPNLRARASRNSLSLKTLIFLRFLYDSCQKLLFYEVFLRVGVTKYCKIHAYLRRARRRTEPRSPPLALKRNR